MVVKEDRAELSIEAALYLGLNHVLVVNGVNRQALFLCKYLYNGPCNHRNSNPVRQAFKGSLTEIK